MFLSSGKLHTSLSNIRLIALRKSHNKFMCICRHSRPDHLFIRCIRLTISNIIHNISCKQVHILLHNTDLTTKLLQFYIPDILSVQTDTSRSNIVKSRNHGTQRRFSRTAASHKRYIFSRLHFQIHMRKYIFLAIFIMETYVIKLYITLHVCHAHRIGTICNVRRNTHDFQKTFVTTVTILELFGKIHQFLDRLCKIVNIQKESYQICCIQLSHCHQIRSHNQRTHRDQRRKCSHTRMIDSHIFIASSLGGHETGISLFELFHFLLFITERFYHTDSRKTVLDLAVDIRNAGTIFFKCTFHLLIQSNRIH